ncbi:MAG: hypothetical protein ACKD6N_05935 [Candidatus Bathyarchaeota archaeon]
MFGNFEVFPNIVQAFSQVEYKIPLEKLQILIVEAFKELNGCIETLTPKILTPTPRSKCIFEVGIAEGTTFIFLGKDEVEKFKEYVKRDSVKNIDFLVRTLYKYKKGEKEISLWSDFYYVRFMFEEHNKFKILINHFKGTRKIPLDILIKKLIQTINKRLKVEGFKPLRIVKIVGH